MQALRSDVVRCLQQARRGLALGLLVAAASACAGCGQPRSFLDQTVMLQQSREAELYWRPDGLAGHAPLAYRAPGAPASQAQKAGQLVAQADQSQGESELFPATYRAVPMPREKPGTATARDATLVAAPPAAEPTRENTFASARPSPPIETPKPTEKPSQPATYVTARPRDDGLMLTSLADSEPLPPLPAERPQPEPPAVADQDAEPLPPLPPAAGPQAQPETAPAEDSEPLPPLPDGMR